MAVVGIRKADNSNHLAMIQAALQASSAFDERRTAASAKLLSVACRSASFFMRQVSAVHYEDIYAKSFVAFRKKYLPLLKKGGGHRSYYVQFTNFMDDTLSKKPHEEPDHHDPVAIYGYPLEYVLKHPADIWYGGQAKYLRVLKARTKNKTLLLQYMTESEANSIIYKMGLPYDTLDKVRLLWPDRVGKGAGSIGRAFFQSMQMDMSAIGKIPRSKSERDTLAKTAVVRSGKDQTALLRKAGFDAIEDTARNQKAAVICDREPEQIAFLHRNAFDVVEIIPLKLSQRKATVGTSQEPRELAPKLAALVASRIGDRIVDKDEYDRTFWTAAGREIAVRFERPASYYEGKKLGEKKHKEAKLHSSYLVKVSLISERGTFSPMAMASERFVDIADDVADRFSRAEPVEGAKPISKASRAAEKEAASQAFRSKEKQKKYDDLKRWAPDYLKEITEVAQKLGLPFTQAEYFNSSDDARELLDSILVVVGRGLTNEAYGAKHLLQEEGPKSWDWYSKYDREKAASAAKESISYLAEDVNADPAVVKEMSDIYEAGLNWMLDNKKWSYQAPAGFFGSLLRDMNESEPESVAAAAKLVAEAAAVLADSRQVFVSASKRSIKQIATDVRGELGFCDQDCVNQSNVLRDALREEGYKADRVFGYLLTDGYYDGAWGKSPIVWGDNLEADRRGKEVETDYHLFHNWVEVDGLVVDIGCDQFNPLLKGKKLPVVYIEKTANAIRHDGQEVVPPKLSAEATPLSAGKVSGYLVNSVIQLKDYLTLNDAGKGYEIASLVWPTFVEWAEEKQPEGVDIDALDADDMYADAIFFIPQEVLASFFKWFERHGSLDGEVAPADRPTFLYMDFNRIVNNEWLVHFSDHADDIAAQGFTRGVNDVAKLGLTTHFREKAGPGFNFAYLATIAADYGRTPGGRASRWKYGKHAVMFKANGVLVYHLSDEEPQVIFLGSTAKDIVELENTDDGWVVIGKDDTTIFRSGDYDTKERKSGSSSGGLKRCVDWVKTNYDQYKNKLNQQAKAPAQNRKMAAGTNK